MTATGLACGPDEVSSSSGSESGSESGSVSESSSDSETDTMSDTETETGDPPLAEPCFTSIETGYEIIWEQQFAWQDIAVINRRGGELIVGDGDQWFVGHPGYFASSFWATSASQLFLGSANIRIWDGQTDVVVLDPAQSSVASITPAGEIWVATHDCNGCPGQVLRWTGEAFEASEAPPLAQIRGLIASDDDRRWAIDDDLFIASQIADAPWSAEGQVPEASPFHRVQLFRDDGQGGLWLVVYESSIDQTRALHRDDQGAWSWADYDPQYTVYNVSAATLDDGVYLFDNHDQSLHRWPGTGPVELVASLPGYYKVFGGPDRLLGVDISHGQAIVELDPGPQPSATTLWEATGVAPSHTSSAVSLDAVYELDRRSLRRWDQGWTYLADSSVSADPESGFFGLWAESADVAWVSEVIDDGLPRTRLWRWQANALMPVAHGIDPDVAIVGLWGSSAERLFGWGLDPLGLASLWFYDGQSWSPLPLPGPTFVPNQVTGDADTLFMVDLFGELHAWDGQTWSQLPTAPAGDLVNHDLVWTGGQLFYRRRAANAQFFFDENWLFVLDGDEWVGIADKWPAGPPTEDAREIGSDGVGGLWLLRYFEDEELHHFDGTTWTPIVLDDPRATIRSGPVTGTPEGVLIHGDHFTQQYRWACE